MNTKQIFPLFFLIIALSLGYYFVIYLPQKGNERKAAQAQIQMALDAKKQALAKFYNEIAAAQDKQDWSKLYDLMSESIKNNVTKSEFIDWANNNWAFDIKKVVSEQTIVRSIQVNGDNGVVERTVVTCLTTECVGDNRKEDNAKREYVYVDGKWQMPDSEPSERALKAASNLYNYESSSDQKVFIKNNGYGSTDENFAIHNYAVSLDRNLNVLVNIETGIEKYKSDQANKPKVIYQQTPVYVPVYQPSYPTNCTSSTFGNYTNTNCY